MRSNFWKFNSPVKRAITSTKNYNLFRSIFDDNVEVNIIYDSSFRSGEPVSFDGIDSWVEYVEQAISEYRSTQHMLGNPLIKFENGVAKARTDLQATHYYKDKDNEKNYFMGVLRYSYGQ